MSVKCASTNETVVLHVVKGEDNAGQRSQKAEDRSLVHQEPYSVSFPTIITLEDIETRGHPTRLGQICRYSQQREADVWPPRMGGSNSDSKDPPMRFVLTTSFNKFREDAS